METDDIIEKNCIPRHNLSVLSSVSKAMWAVKLLIKICFNKILQFLTVSAG